MNIVVFCINQTTQNNWECKWSKNLFKSQIFFVNHAPEQQLEIKREIKVHTDQIFKKEQMDNLPFYSPLAKSDVLLT